MACTAAYTVTLVDVRNEEVTNTATASGTPPNASPITSAPSIVVVNTVPQPAIALTKTVTPAVGAIGDKVSYHFNVTNTGNEPLTAVHVNDVFAPPAGPPVDVTCPDTALQPGDSMTCTGPYTLTQRDADNGGVNNTATATGTPPTGTPVTSPPAVAAVGIAGEPEITLTKAADVADTNGSGVTDTGDVVSWTFEVTNTGNLTLTHATINDPTAGPVNCPGTALPPGATTTCHSAEHTITAAEAAVGTLRNTATATATAPGGAAVTSSPATAQVAIRTATPTTSAGVSTSASSSIIATPSAGPGSSTPPISTSSAAVSMSTTPIGAPPADGPDLPNTGPPALSVELAIGVRSVRGRISARQRYAHPAQGSAQSLRFATRCDRQIDTASTHVAAIVGTLTAINGARPHTVHRIDALRQFGNRENTESAVDI